MNVTFDIMLGEFTWKSISLSHFVVWNKPKCYVFCFFGCFCSGEGEKADTARRWWISAAQKWNCLMQNRSSLVLETACSPLGKKGLWKQQRSSPEIEACLAPVSLCRSGLKSWRSCQELCSGGTRREWACRLHPVVGKTPLFYRTAPCSSTPPLLSPHHLGTLGTTTCRTRPELHFSCPSCADSLVSHCRKGW